jgi:hypothetical protein
LEECADWQISSWPLALSALADCTTIFGVKEGEKDVIFEMEE